MVILFLVGRIAYGGFFFLSGLKHFTHLEPETAYARSKGIPAPKLAVIGSGILIVLGGLGVLSGIYMMASLALIILFLVPVTFTMHAFWADADPNMRTADEIEFGKNMALLGAALMLFAAQTGYGPFFKAP